MPQDARSLRETRRKLDLQIAEAEEREKRFSINRHVNDRLKTIEETENEKHQELQHEIQFLRAKLSRQDHELKKKNEELKKNNEEKLKNDEEIRKKDIQIRELYKTMGLKFKALSEEVILIFF